MANQITIQLLGDVKDLQKKLGSSEKTLSRFGNVAKKATKFVTGGLAGIGAAAATLGFQRLKGIEEARAKLTGLGHDAKDVEGIMDSALAAVQGTSYGLADAATAAASASAAGIKGGQQMTDYLKMVGNAAALTGRDYNSMASIINKVNANTKLSMGEVNQIQDAGIPILQKLADHYQVTTAEMSKMVSQGEVDAQTFNKVLTKTVGNAADEMGNTFMGSLNNMKAALGRIGASFLGPIFAKAPALFQRVTKAMKPLEDGAARLAPAIGRIFSAKVGPLFNNLKRLRGPLKTLQDSAGKAWSSFVDVLPSVKTFLQGVYDVLKPLAVVAAGGAFALLVGAFEGLSAALQVLSPVLEAVGSFFSNNVATVATFVGILAGYAAAVALVAKVKAVWTAAQIALNTALAANPIGIVVVALAALAAGLVFAYKRSETFRNIVNAAWGAVRAATAKVFGWMRGFIVGAWNVIKGAFNIAKTVVGWVVSAWNRAKSVTSSVWNAIKSGLSKAWNGIRTAISTGVNNVMQTITNLKSRVTGFFSGAASWLLSAGKAIIQGLIDGIESMIGTVKDKLTGLTDFIPDWKGPRSRDKRLLTPAGKAIMQSLIKGFDKGIPGVKKVLNNLTKRIEKHYKNLYPKNAKRAKQFTKAAIRSLADETKALNKNARRRERIYKRLANAEKTLADRRKQMADYARGIADNILGYGSVTNLNSAFNADAMINQMRARVEKVKQFNKTIQSLIKSGLNKQTVSELANAGVEGGLAYAEALAAGGPSAIKEYNSLQSVLTKQANNLGNAAAKDMHQSGVKAAQGVVKGLRKQKRQAERAARQLGRALTRAFNQSLNLKAPNLKAAAAGAGGNTYNINVRATPGTNKAALGKEIVSLIDAYEKSGGKKKR